MIDRYMMAGDRGIYILTFIIFMYAWSGCSIVNKQTAL